MAKTPSPWEISEREQEIRNKYEGKDATLDDQPATISSTMQGRVAVVKSSIKSGEVSWLMLEQGMMESQGRFRLEGGHRAVPIHPEVLKRAEEQLATETNPLSEISRGILDSALRAVQVANDGVEQTERYLESVRLDVNKTGDVLDLIPEASRLLEHIKEDIEDLIAGKTEFRHERNP